MYFILDLIAIILFLVVLVSCYRKGFLKSFLSSLKVLLSIILAYVFTPTVSFYIRTGFVEEKVTGIIGERISAMTIKTAEFFNLKRLFEDMPEEFRKIISSFGADGDVLRERYGDMASATEESIEAMARTIAAPAVKIISNSIAFALLFIGIMLVITIVIHIVGLITHLPLIGGLDRALGFVLGIFTGVLVIVVFCNLSYYAIKALNMVSPSRISENVIENTYVVRYLSEFFGFKILGK